MLLDLQRWAQVLVVLVGGLALLGAAVPRRHEGRWAWLALVGGAIWTLAAAYDLLLLIAVTAFRYSFGDGDTLVRFVVDHGYVLVHGWGFVGSVVLVVASALSHRAPPARDAAPPSAVQEL